MITLREELGAEVEFNIPPDTIQVISEAVFTANHLTDTNKQNSTGKYTNQLPWFRRLLGHSAS